MIVALLLNTNLYTMDHAEQSERGRTRHKVDRIDLDEMYSIDPEFKKFLNTQPKKADVTEVPTQQMNTHKTHKKHLTGCIPGFNALRALSIAVQYYLMK